MPRTLAMIKQTIGSAIAMIILGVVAYFVSGMASVTALIPSFFGAIIGVLGFLAIKRLPKGGAKPMLIGAMVVSVLGFLGPAGRVLPSLFKGELTMNTATIVQIVFALLAAYLAFVLGMGLFKKK